MFLISKNFCPFEGSSQGISYAFHISYPRRKKDETEQPFTLTGSKTLNIYENQSRQGRKEKNVLFETHIW